MNFADTNCLTVVYLPPRGDQTSRTRDAMLSRFMRMHGGTLLISRLVFWEARNVFSRLTAQSQPEEWHKLVSDLGSRIILADVPMAEWERESFALCARHSAQMPLGTFDVWNIAAAKLSGAQRFLSFDGTARALAHVSGMEVFPPLTSSEKNLRARLKRK